MKRSCLSEETSCVLFPFFLSEAGSVMLQQILSPKKWFRESISLALDVGKQAGDFGFLTFF